MTPSELKEILAKHGKWRRGEDGGERANLTGADLTGADLRDANLTGAKIDRRTKGLYSLSDEQQVTLKLIDVDGDDSASLLEDRGAQETASTDLYLRSDRDREEGSKRISVEAYRTRLVSVDGDLRLAWFYLDQPPPNFESDEIAEAYRGLHDLCRDLIQIVEGQRAQIEGLRNEKNARRDGRVSNLERRIEAMNTEFNAAKNEAEPILKAALRAAVVTTAVMSTSGMLVGLAAAIIARTLEIELLEAINLILAR